MPTAALRPCSVCRQLGCTSHKRPAWGHARPVKRVTGRRLQRQRMDLWASDPTCQQCHRLIAPDQTIRDHVIPLAEGGQDIPENTQLLCRECSDIKTQQEARRGMWRSR